MLLNARSVDDDIAIVLARVDSAIVRSIEIAIVLADVLVDVLLVAALVAIPSLFSSPSLSPSLSLSSPSSVTLTLIASLGLLLPRLAEASGRYSLPSDGVT